MEIMATRGCLQYDPYGPSLPPSSISSIAAVTLQQMSANPHSNAQRRASSLLTSYRLLDILAGHSYCHPDVQLTPSNDVPRLVGEPTHLLQV